MKKKNEFGIITLLAVYISLIAIIGAIIFFIPSIVRNVELNYVKAVQEEIETILTTTKDEKIIAQKLDELRKDKPFEISVNTQGKKVYQSLNGITYENLYENIQKEVLLYETQGTIDTSFGKYNVWYAIYKLDTPHYFDGIATIFLGIVVISSLLLFGVMIIIRRRSISPLLQLRKAIDKLENYEFTEITENVDTKDNEMIESLVRFSNDLREKMLIVESSYSEFEETLEMEKECLSTTVAVSRGIIHDLKTPLHQIILQNEMLLQEWENIQYNKEEVIEFNIQRIEKVMEEINESLLLMDDNIEAIIMEQYTFDVTTIVKETRERLRSTIAKRAILLDVVMPDELIIHSNKVKMSLIIHNIFSNAINYAIPDSEVEFSLFCDDEFLYIECENQATEKDTKYMEAGEQMLQMLNRKSENDYSSGNGLFLTRELAELLGGTYKMTIDEMNVVVQVSIPLGIQTDSEVV